MGCLDSIMALFNIQIAKDQESLAQLTSQVISNQIKSVLIQKERFQLALSGGSTPCKAYTYLREEKLPWCRVDVLLGDERWVSSSDESSNALMLQRTLLASGPGKEACFRPVPTVELNSPEDSANVFSKVITEICRDHPPCFDLILLGLGEDGHTASLFPGASDLNIKGRYAIVGEGKGQKRITLSAEVLSAASKVIFLVSGDTKQVALKRLLDPSESFERTPAKLVRPKSEVLILADKAAAELI